MCSIRPSARAPRVSAPRFFAQTLVVAEVALAVVLLVGSGLFLASFARVMNVDLGLDPDDVLTVQVRVLELPADIQRSCAAQSSVAD